MDEMDDILREFIVETYEGLDHLDRDLVTLEQDPSSSEVLGRIFRTIHTIKGSSGFLSLERLESVTHVGENLLSLLRDQRLDLRPEITSALLQMADVVREIIDNVEREGNEGADDYAELVQTLGRLADLEPSDSSCESEQGLDGTAESSPVDVPIEQSQTPDWGDALASDGSTSASEPEPQSPAEPRPTGGDSPRASVAESTIRVDVGLLDTLMNLVGELVLARNQILQHSATYGDSGVANASQRLNLVTTELQEGVMKTRMQPIGNVWGKFPRVVRDLALSCGKSVRIEMEGRDTELDKTIIESIKDPLTHAIRNSVDHGIEAPEDRVAAGKPEQGRILLRAFHEGGQVNIEVSDDGKGICPKKVLQTAVAKGLVTSERGARMSDKEMVNLITTPGFSTADTITNVSGRGVGMDVVRTNIEKIGGGVDIQSVPGEGTTLKIKIPLTLAIIPALIVTSGGDRFAIPQVNLLELVRLESEQAGKLEMIQGAPVYRLRGTLLPLAFLNRELGRESDCVPESATAALSTATNIVVLQADDQQFGLVVEEVLDTEEIVVKPLGKQLKGVPSFAGAAIMGDGRVALILDVLGLAQTAEIVGPGSKSRTTHLSENGESSGDSFETLLLVANRDGTRAALPLSAVNRLEEFPRDRIERSGGDEVVQYRGEIMPLVSLSEALGRAAAESDQNGRVKVVVVRVAGRQVGIVVENILDIIDDECVVADGSTHPGIKGPVSVQGKVADLLDVNRIVASVRSDLVAQEMSR